METVINTPPDSPQNINTIINTKIEALDPIRADIINKKFEALNTYLTNANDWVINSCGSGIANPKYACGEILNEKQCLDSPFCTVDYNQGICVTISESFPALNTQLIDGYNQSEGTSMLSCFAHNNKNICEAYSLWEKTPGVFVRECKWGYNIGSHNRTGCGIDDSSCSNLRGDNTENQGYSRNCILSNICTPDGVNCLPDISLSCSTFNGMPDNCLSSIGCSYGGGSNGACSALVGYSCDSISSQGKCEENLQCNWNNNSQGCEVDNSRNCSAIQGQNNCESNFYCNWDGNSCSNKDCNEFITQEDCQGSTNSCSWTGTACQ